MKLDHVGVQLKNLEQNLNWYQYVFNCEKSWELDQFSHLTLSRLPGIKRLVELKNNDLKLHLFERDDLTPASNVRAQFQHTAIDVQSKQSIKQIVRRIHETNVSSCIESISEIITDDSLMSCCYFMDPEGNEYELVAYEHELK